MGVQLDITAAAPAPPAAETAAPASPLADLAPAQPEPAHAPDAGSQPCVACARQTRARRASLRAPAAAMTAGALAESSSQGERGGAAWVGQAEDEIMPGEPSGRDLVAQRGVCGAVRVACRSLCPDAGLRRTVSDQARRAALGRPGPALLRGSRATPPPGFPGDARVSA